MNWSGIPRDRVVAVVATGGGWRRISTGFLFGPRIVLTARHGLAVGDSSRSADVVRVVGASATWKAAAPITADGLDVAVLELDTEVAGADFDSVRWGRVDRTASGRLLTAEAVGYPLWQEQIAAGEPMLRDLAELRGVIRPLEGVGSGLLTIRDRDLETVNLPTDAKGQSPWGGLSGAAVFAEGGHLLGIVVEHRPNDGTAALRILPVDEIARVGSGTHLARLLGVADLRDVPWAYPDPGHALARAHRSAERLRPAGGLRGRESEVVSLSKRIESEPWTWVVGDAFAGKTALLATLVAHPPDGVALVSCFLRRREGLASAEYVLDSLTAQLAALTWAESFTSQAQGKAELFDRMLQLATNACVRRGNRLAVVIDGLDEYDRQASVPLRAWLPVVLPADVALLVTGRPGTVPTPHPLSGNSVSLAPFEGSDSVWEAAREEMNEALRAPGPLVRLIAKYMAATDGGLTDDELAQLCSATGLPAHADQVAELVDRRFDRTLARSRSLGPVVFIHAAYREALANLIGPIWMERARVDVDEWVDRMRAPACGTGPAPYALRPYGRHLRVRLDEALEAGDPAAAQASARRLTDTVSSPHRWLALFRGEGTPVAGDAEISETVQALLQTADAGLLDPAEARLQACLVGLGRGLVHGRVSQVAVAVARVWAIDGRLNQATELATAIVEPDARASALAEVVGGLARSHQDAASVEATTQAALAAAEEAGPYRDSARTLLADALRGAGCFAAAGEVAAALEKPEMRALALAQTARDSATAGQPSIARALAEQVGAIPIINYYNAKIFWAAVGVAETLTLCGDDEQAAATLNAARDAVDTGFEEYGRDYLSLANDILEVGRLRCRALEVSGNRPPADLNRTLAEFRELAAAIPFAPLGAWQAGHVAAVWCGRVPDAARELADLVVEGVLNGAGANWDRDSRWVGATPADIAGLFIDSGLLDAAQRILDSDLLDSDPRAGSGWKQGLHVRLVGALGGAGRLDDADRIAGRLDGGLRMGALAQAGAECLTGCSDGTLLVYLAPRARKLVDDTLVAAAESESEQRLASVLGLISQRLEDTTKTSIINPRRPVTAVVNDLTRLNGIVAELTRLNGGVDNADASKSIFDNNDASKGILSGAAAYMRTLRELVEIDSENAALYVDDAHAHVGGCFTALTGRIIPPLNAFRAAHDLTHVLMRLGSDAEARTVAKQMAAQLSPKFGAVGFAMCLPDTIAALEQAALLDRTEADRLVELAWAGRDEMTWGWHTPAKIAVTLAAVSTTAAPLFSTAVVDLLREGLAQPMHKVQDNGWREWYEPALRALAHLLSNGAARPAAEVAHLLLDLGCDPSTPWYERGAILGGLVQAGEPSTCGDALARFITEEAFAYHVDHLPLELLQRMKERLDTNGALGLES